MAFILGGVFIDANIPVMAQLNNPSFLEFNTFGASYNPAIPCVVPVDDIWQAGYDITMLDIVAIQRHILGIKELPKPYSWIAADVNNSGSITTLDVIILQQVILGLRTSFGNVPTYRIIPRFALSNESPFSASFFANPFTAVWDRNGVLFSYSGTQSYMNRFRLDLPNEAIQAPQTFSFIAIKTGDVYQ